MDGERAGALNPSKPSHTSTLAGMYVTGTEAFVPRLHPSRLGPETKLEGSVKASVQGAASP